MASPFFLLLAILGLTNFAIVAPFSVSQRDNEGIYVNLRIEGATETIFEGPVFSSGHNVTTQSGGTHHCDGTNNDTHLTPGPTATSALDNASDVSQFTWDGYVTILFS